jgi:hypothetical protein
MWGPYGINALSRSGCVAGKHAIQRFHEADRDPKRDPGERNLASLVAC